jgi:GT2 family glycosyltransferase
MDVSIVFVNYRTEALLLDCFRSIYTHTKNIQFECIVVDNHPIPGANEDILMEFPNTIWVNSGGNVGFSKANNLGIKLAKGDYVLFLNADTLLFDNAIGNAWKHLKLDSNLIAVGGIQVDAQQNSIPFYRTLNNLRRDFYILPNHAICHKIVDKLLPKEEFKQPEETNNIVGAFLMTNSKTLLEINGWDEDFFMYAEDAEISFRLHQKGKLAYFEDVKFIHLIQENPFRRTDFSWVNRFAIQIQVSNLLWVRKSYGILAFLVIYLNYSILAPLFWGWKITLNIFKGRKWNEDTRNQRIFSQKLGILYRYFWSIIFLKKGPYKIKDDENIDHLNKS